MTALHHHGIDCCRACFHGWDSHPDGPDDSACQRERAEFGSASDCARADLARMEDT